MNFDEKENLQAATASELNEINGNLLISGLAQQTGVKLEDEKTGIAVDEISIPEEQAEHLRITPLEDLPVTLKVADELHSLVGLSELIKELREHLLELKFIEDKTELRSNELMPELNQKTSDQKQIPLDQNLSAELLRGKKSIIDQYVKKQVRIALLFSAINQLPVADFLEDKNYSLVREQLANWQYIINSIVPNLAKDQRVQELIDSEYRKQVGPNQEELERLRKLMSGERAGEDQGRVTQLRKRVLKALIKNTSILQKESVAHDLSEELFETASLVNDWRIIDRFKDEAKINLLAMKRKVRKYQEQSQQNPERSGELNKKLIEKIIVPITDASAKLFPHEDSNSPTLIAATLYRKEAVCAGKAEILTSIFRLLGLKSQSVRVPVTIDDGFTHVVNLTTLFNKNLLIADANYPSGTEAFPDELAIWKKDDPKIYEDILKHIANGKIIGQRFETLVYQMNKISKEIFDQLTTNKSQLLNRQGQNEYYQTEIPYPHQKIIQGEESPFFNHNNYLNILRESNQAQKAEHHYKKSLIINPHDSVPNYDYAQFLSFNSRRAEALPYFAKAAQDKDHPGIIDILVKYGDCLADFDKEKAEKQYQEALTILRNKPQLETDFDEGLINSRIAQIQRW